MFLKGLSKGRETMDGSVGKGPFILLFQQKWDPATETMPRELRALVRTVEYRSLGNFMMGKVIIKMPERPNGEVISLSGAFGNDNLPKDCPEDLWQYLHPLPEDVTEAFWKADGGNEPGTGSYAIHDWVRPRYKELRKLKHDNAAKSSGKESAG